MSEKDDTNAMDSITAGYNRQRGIEPEVPAASALPSPTEVDPAVSEVAASATGGEAEPTAPAAATVETPPAEPSIDERIERAMQKQLSGFASAEEIRKIHGKFGELNKNLLALQQRQVEAKPAEKAEISADIAEALKQAEAVAEDFPDIAGPIVSALKVLGSKQPAAPTPPMSDEDFERRYQQRRQAEVIEVLAEDHPDWEKYRLGAAETPSSFKEWFASQSQERQSRYRSTNSPATISRYLTEYKEWDAAQVAAAQAKKDRLETATTPRGEGTSAGPSVLPDSAGLAAGYNRVRRLRTAA